MSETIVARLTLTVDASMHLVTMSGDVESLGDLSLCDEVDLRAYFATDLPPAPGARSNFGAMCERIANARNPNTDEVPTPLVVHRDGTMSGAAWTEILDCPLGHGGAADAEDGFIAYVDARRRHVRVERALACVTKREQEILAAHYATGRVMGVAALMELAVRENRDRAARGCHEPVRATLDSLAKEAMDASRPNSSRETARTKLAAIRSEAAELLTGARASYARAASQVRS